MNDKKAGIYSPISLEALKLIGQRPKKIPNLLMSYLVLARFAGQADVGGFGSNRVIGAGAQKVSEVLGIQWKRARLLIEELIQLDVISVAPTSLKVGKCPARFVLAHEGKVEIPHALIDGLDKVPGIMRLLNQAHGQLLETIATAIMVLVHCYSRHNMEAWGGVDSEAIRHDWVMDEVVPSGHGFRVKARRGTSDSPSCSQSFFTDVMASLGFEGPDFPAGNVAFRAALQFLEDSGLVYEAVTLVDRHDKPLYPVRINDAYAVRSSSEPSQIESIPGAAYYTGAQHPTGAAEGVWFFFPVDPGKEGMTLVGVTRLRFRCANSSTARGLIRDADNIQALRVQLIKADMIDDL
ncbi:MAG: hypothetical protein Q7K57_52390 [Burkholderiaceae bacterium]|nr:hypothetical protein [Burkholderiaceae bacterium]